MFDLPELEPAEVFAALRPFNEIRGVGHGRPPGHLPAGAELAALREAVPDVRATLVASGMASAVTTCDLITLPYPTRFGFWRAALTPAPFLWITNRMLVVQWDDADGHTRTLLWEPSDHERGEYTPYFERLQARNPLPDSMLSTRHGTVLGHLRALGIDPADVDYLAFDHLHTQDVRRLIGTTEPAVDLGSPDGPVVPWFPNARLLTQYHEWETIRHLHPIQAPWYQPDTYRHLPSERLLLLDGDVVLGPGVALIATPGHTAGNQTLVLRTERGVWTSSENGIAAESWSPHASGIAGLRRFALQWGQDVIMNANTLEYASWQYNSMVVEAALADPTPEGRFRQCFPSSELTASRWSPGTAPTYVHGGIEHGQLRGSSATSTSTAGQPAAT